MAKASGVRSRFIEILGESANAVQPVVESTFYRPAASAAQTKPFVVVAAGLDDLAPRHGDPGRRRCRPARRGSERRPLTSSSRRHQRFIRLRRRHEATVPAVTVAASPPRARLTPPIGRPTVPASAWISRPCTVVRRRSLAAVVTHAFLPTSRFGVDHGGGRAGFAAQVFPQIHVQAVPDRVPDAVTLEVAEDVIAPWIVVGNRRAAGSATDNPCAGRRGSRSALAHVSAAPDDRPTGGQDRLPVCDHSASVVTRWRSARACRSCGALRPQPNDPACPRTYESPTKACATGFWVRL